MTPATIGGILLITGAFFTMQGDVYKAILVYFFADLCWVFLAYTTGDWFGGIVTIIGMTFGFVAFLRMHSGKYNKLIRRE